MSQVGKYLNLHSHMQKWGVYNENGPYTTDYVIGYISPAQFGGLTYKILAEKGGDVYVINTESFGRCAIWAPRDADSSITTSPVYPNGDTSGGSGGGSNPGGGSGNGQYLNLHGHMQRWGVYNENGPYTTDHVIGYIYPAQFGGLTYRILAEKGGDVYVINTESFGRCAIWAPRDADSSITTSPVYPNGDTSGGSGGEVGDGNSSIRIVKRSEWGAKPVIEPDMSGVRTTPYKYIVIHHSAAEQYNSDIEQIRATQNYHQSIEWGDIGYNYCIGKFGTVMQGREEKYVGAHTLGERNRDGIGICLFGNFEGVCGPTQIQLDNLIPLLALLCTKHGISPYNIGGHRDFGSTSCPGSCLYDMLDEIRAKVIKKIEEDNLNKEILKVAGNNGLFKDCEIEFTALNQRTPAQIVSFYPTVIIETEISLKQKITGYTTCIDLSADINQETEKLYKNISDAGIEFDISKKSIRLSLEKLHEVEVAGSLIKYTFEIDFLGETIINLEAEYNYKSSKIYQNIIITIKPSRPTLDEFLIPVAVPVEAISNDQVYNIPDNTLSNSPLAIIAVLIKVFIDRLSPGKRLKLASKNFKIIR